MVPGMLRIGMSCIALGRILRGGELIVAQLASHLAARGHEVTVYQSGPRLEEARFRSVVLPVPFHFYDLEAPPLGLSAAALRGRLRRVQALAAIWGFSSAVMADALRRRYDVFLIQQPRPEGDLHKLLRRRCGTRVLALGNGPLRGDALMVCGGLDAFIATSPVQASWARYFHASPVTLLKMGVDLRRFTATGPAAPEVQALPAPRVLMCGALIPLKRVHLAIEALARLQRGSLIVVGDGAEREALRALGERRLPGRVLFTGAVPHRDLAAYYRAADVLAFPSTSAETSGQVILEAMACGTPAVATDDSTRLWMVGEGGLLAPVEDADAFARALAQASDGSMRAAARRQAERCGWDRVAEGFERLCLDLLGGHAPDPAYGPEEHRLPPLQEEAWAS